MPRYLIKVGISNSLESTLVNDLNTLSQVIYTAGGSVVNLNVKSRARQIWVQIDAQASVIQSLLEAKALSADLIRSVYLIEECAENSGNRYVEELGFAGFIQGRTFNNSMAIQVYPH